MRHGAITQGLANTLEQSRKTINDIPDDVLVGMGVKIYSLCSLAWDYIDTVLDTVISLRIQETKPLVRKIRELKREYDKFRARDLGAKDVEKEYEQALTLEDEVSADLAKLNFSLFNDISRMKLSDDHRVLVTAVQQAMTMLDAVKIFARQCDSVIESYGLPHIDCALLHKEILALYPLVPQFAGDCYELDQQARKITAQIIVKRLNEFQIIREDEK